MDLKEKKYDDEFLTKLIAKGIAVLVMLIVLHEVISYFWGVKEIDHFFESSQDYTAKYYVTLFQEDNKVKVPADINVGSYCDLESCYGSTSIGKVYLQDGSYLYFDDCELGLESTVSCVDQNNVSWNIEFNKEIVK